MPPAADGRRDGAQESMVCRTISIRDKSAGELRGHKRKMMEYVVDIDSRGGPPSGEQSAGPSREPARKPAPREVDPRPRAIVGGVDYAVGGWGEYEVDRRRARWEATRTGPSTFGAREADRPAARYPGRTYVSADDT